MVGQRQQRYGNREEKNPNQNIELTLNLSGHDNLHRHPIVLAEPQVNENGGIRTHDKAQP